jgi:hypothetical protein
MIIFLNFLDKIKQLLDFSYMCAFLEIELAKKEGCFMTSFRSKERDENR